MKSLVCTLLEENLPPTLLFHNLDHTLYVFEKAIEIARAENCSKNEIRLIATAALWHDTGFLITYKNHEKKSCKLAREHLPAFGYTQQEIDLICGMIMATQIPQTPATKLGEVIADADLEYLGTEFAEQIASFLHRELNLIFGPIDEDQWKKTQIRFLTEHRYHTEYCRIFKDPQKKQYLEKLTQQKIG